MDEEEAERKMEKKFANILPKEFANFSKYVSVLFHLFVKVLNTDVQNIKQLLYSM